MRIGLWPSSGDKYRLMKKMFIRSNFKLITICCWRTNDKDVTATIVTVNMQIKKDLVILWGKKYNRSYGSKGLPWPTLHCITKRVFFLWKAKRAWETPTGITYAQGARNIRSCVLDGLVALTVNGKKRGKRRRQYMGRGRASNLSRTARKKVVWYRYLRPGFYESVVLARFKSAVFVLPVKAVDSFYHHKMSKYLSVAWWK